MTFANVSVCDQSTRPSPLPSKMWPWSMGRLNSHMAVFDSEEVAASVAVSSSFDSPASFMARPIPSPIMYAVWAAVS